jgi:hypothetical protein
MQIEVKPHEVEAMRNLMVCARAFAKILDKQTGATGPGDQYVSKLHAWAGIVEQMLERINAPVGEG